jgi:hypothetical protein
MSRITLLRGRLSCPISCPNPCPSENEIGHDTWTQFSGAKTCPIGHALGHEIPRKSGRIRVQAVSEAERTLGQGFPTDRCCPPFFRKGTQRRNPIFGAEAGGKIRRITLNIAHTKPARRAWCMAPTRQNRPLAPFERLLFAMTSPPSPPASLPALNLQPQTERQPN